MSADPKMEEIETPEQEYQPMTSKAFPKNVEPKGRTRFGPPPSKPKPTTKNVFNTDPQGTKRPVEK